MTTEFHIGAARLRAAAAVLVLAAGTGCGVIAHRQTEDAPPPAIPAGTADLASPAGTWYSPPAEYPGICMTLAPNGALQFAGGYAFFNPGRWRYDSASTELRLELGGKAPLPAVAQATRQQGEQQHRHQGALLRADEASRTLVYRVTPETDSIDIGGFVFYRKASCETRAN